MTRARIWAPWTAVAVVLIVLVSFAQSSSGRDVMRNLGLVKDADRYVALSFSNVNGLPYSVPFDRRPSLPVTIENKLGKTTLYKLRATQAGSPRVLAQNAVIIPEGSSRQIDVVVPVACKRSADATEVRVTLTLSPSNHSIDHTMLCRTAP